MKIDEFVTNLKSVLAQLEAIAKEHPEYTTTRNMVGNYVLETPTGDWVNYIEFSTGEVSQFDSDNDDGDNDV